MNRDDSSMQRDTRAVLNDTRRMTVAEEHLRNALEEVNTAQGSTEKSIQTAACQRALSHLDLVLNRLQAEADLAFRQEREPEVNEALSCTRRAWQLLHDALNDWDYASARAIPEARVNLLAALKADEAALEVGMRDEALMS